MRILKNKECKGFKGKYQKHPNKGNTSWKRILKLKRSIEHGKVS